MGSLLALLKISLLIQGFVQDAGEFKTILELCEMGWIAEHEMDYQALVTTINSLKTVEWE